MQTRVQKAERSQDDMQQLVSALRSRPEADVQAIIQRLRSGHEVESIVRHLTTSDLLLQLSVKPGTTHRFEFPFHHRMPSFLQMTGNRYLGSILYQIILDPSEGLRKSCPTIKGEYSAEYLMPYASATVVDPKLDNVKPSKWTQVSTDDELMRRLLKLYFQYEYPSWLLFQKDLFLEDMLSGSSSYCSPLLVNAVLAYACVSSLLIIHFRFFDRKEMHSI